MSDEIELETSVYQCTHCVEKQHERRIPCTVVMGSGEIPDSCLFSNGTNHVTWECLQT